MFRSNKSTFSGHKMRALIFVLLINLVFGKIESVDTHAARIDVWFFQSRATKSLEERLMKKAMIGMPVHPNTNIFITLKMAKWILHLESSVAHQHGTENFWQR